MVSLLGISEQDGKGDEQMGDKMKVFLIEPLL